MLPGYGMIVGFEAGAAAGSMVAAASPTDVAKTGSTRGADKTLTTSSVTVTATGGAGGYTYAWTRIAGNPAITATAATAATTAFAATLAPDQEVHATFRCTVTDAASNQASADVEVTITLIFIDVGGTL